MEAATVHTFVMLILCGIKLWHHKNRWKYHTPVAVPSGETPILSRESFEYYIEAIRSIHREFQMKNEISIWVQVGP